MRESGPVSLAKKLQIKPGQSVAVLGDSRGAELDLAAEHPSAAEAGSADVVITFAANSEELATVREPLLAAARQDTLAWVAYPKGGQLGTDLNRDSLRDLLMTHGVQPVRQIAIDDTWSALRLRPA
jgi:hypothetical protein